MDLNCKKVLFIAPVLFGYEKDIERELTARGAEVNFIPENLDHLNLGYKIMCSMPAKLRTKWIHSYFIKRMNQFDSYDVIFVIRGVWLDQELLNRMKKTYKAKWIMYQWDGAKNLPNLEQISEFFEEKFTFDRVDSEQLSKDGSKWKYRPLFFAKEFEQCHNQEKAKYDLFYNGSLHSGRAAFLKKLQQFAKEKKLSLKGSLFMKRVNFLKRKYINGEYRELQKGDITHKSTDREELVRLMGESNIIVDYTNPNQTGLTMRSIESLGAHKKFATNNKAIANESFFHPDNIYIYDEENFTIPDEFLGKAYQPVAEEIYRKYSLKGWIEDIFGKNEDEK